MKEILFTIVMIFAFITGALVAKVYYDNKESKYKYDVSAEIESECHKYKLIYDKAEGLCK